MKKTLLINTSAYVMDASFIDTQVKRNQKEMFIKHASRWKEHSDTFVSLHKIVKARVENNSYEEYKTKEHSALWFQLFNNNLSDVFIVIGNSSDKEINFALTIVRHCYFNGINSYIANLNAYCKLIPITPMPLTHVKDYNNLTTKQWHSWNAVSDTLRERIPELETRAISAQAYRDLTDTNKTLLQAIVAQTGPLQLPCDDRMAFEVSINAKPYDIELSTPYKATVSSKSFINDGSLSNPVWSCTNQNALKDVDFGDKYQQTLQAWLTIHYYKCIGIEPNTDAFHKCPVCGQWFGNSTEHCPLCDTFNTDFIDVELRDFQYDAEDVKEAV